MSTIMARMGLDTSGLNKDLRAASETLESHAKKLSSTVNGAAHGSGHGKEHGGKGNQARVIGDLLDSVTGEKGWVMKMNMLQHSLPLAAIAAGVMGMKAMQEATERVAEASKEMQEVLSKPMGVTVAAGPEAVIKGIKEIDAAQEKFKQSMSGISGFAAVMWEPMEYGWKKAWNAITGDHLIPSNALHAEKQNEELTERKFALSKALTESLRTETAARGEAHKIGKEALAVVETDFQTRQKIAAIQEDHTLPPDAQRALIDQVKAEGEEKKAQARAAYTANQINLEVEKTITAVQQKGADVAVKSLEARIEGERLLAENAPDGGARDEHRAKANAMVVELENLKRSTAEHRAQLALEIEVANFKGGADERHEIFLDKENAMLLDRRRNAKADQREELDAAIAKNEQARLEAATSRISKNAHLQSSAVDAIPGEGQENDALKLGWQLQIARQKQLALKFDPGASKEARADADKEVAEIEKKLTDIYRTYENTNEAARQGTAEMKEQLAHHDQIAEALRTQFEYQQKIAQAQNDHNDDLANSLRQQQRLSLDLQIQKLQQQVGDKSKATLAELAANAHNQDGAAARQVERLEARAQRERKQGHAEKARKLQEDADKLKNGDHDPKGKAQKLQDEANKFWAKPGRANQDHARIIQDQANKLRGGIGALKDGDKVQSTLESQLKELGEIRKEIGAVGEVR